MNGTRDLGQPDAGSQLLDEAWMASATPDDVAVLLDAGANVQARDDRGRTPLHQAASGKNWAVVTLLLSRGADVLAEDGAGETPRRVIRSFFAAKAVPPVGIVPTNDDPGGWRQNPDYDPREARRILLRHVSRQEADAVPDGAPDPGSGHPTTPASAEHWLATATPAEVASLLDAGASVHARDDQWRTPLHVVTEHHNHAVAALLLDRGADPNATDEQGTTALHTAFRAGDGRIVGLLLDAGAVSHREDRDGRTALHAATASGDLETVRLMLDHGADPNTGRETALHAAAENGDLDLVRLLLDSGADPARRSETACTPLHNAARRGGNPAVVRLLLDRGADVNARANCGYTPLHMAAWAGNEDPAIPELLLDRGADLNAEDDAGQTALHHAAAHNPNPDILALLLDRGANPHTSDKAKRRPLHLAAKSSENPRVLELLLERGAFVDARNDEGATPLHLAAGHHDDSGLDPPTSRAWSSSLDPEIMAPLLDEGADVNAQDDDGCTPLHRVAEHGADSPAVGLLLERGAVEKDRSRAVSGRCRSPHPAFPRGNSMNQEINFEPWKGDYYGHHNNLGFPARLLLLGESHYGPARPDITREVVEEAIDGTGGSYRFFTSIHKAICRAEQETTLAEFCHAVAFYNFIQEMIDTPGSRPGAEAWKRGIGPFFKCLDTLKPSHVVACGFTLWDNLPNERFSCLSDETEQLILGRLPEQGKRPTDCRLGDRIGRYSHAGGSCLILRIRHPSRGFSAAKWHPVLQSFFQLQAD